MAERIIDLRSDTVTQPTSGMRQAMMEAPLGDDVWGDDPTVNELQEICASMFGKEDACFVPSGTMANQTAIRSQTQPGDEIIVHKESHIVHYEAGGAAALSGCSFALASGDRGLFTANDVRTLYRPDDDHFGKSKLISLENTHNRGGGSIWPLQQLVDVCETAHELGLRTHLDGARIWHAIIATDIDAKTWAKPFDSVSACFSKGLGCPAGSIVVGDKQTIYKVRRARKMFGGTMRQSGILAGAAIYAIKNHLERLKADHSHAKMLAKGLNTIDGITCNAENTQTNLVFFDIDKMLGDGVSLCRKLWENGVLAESLDLQKIRFVTHLNVTVTEIEKAIQITADVCKNASM
ncbi:MAG: aminotransferase class I/II-fold pyridoxal phosphate-dependent enzyme [Phycisphaerales bacterium]|nr:aminotransferase class I/II-fold pyridoxal phosphate-dependent enzyme [Planctomycetota bacterium]MBL6997705.1 aminotransferase class I/II-fold pyridoxal phosphate-dependent enzyme [Phycisphaerales bacterium]